MVEYLSMKHRILKVTASAVAIGTLSEAIVAIRMFLKVLSDFLDLESRICISLCFGRCG